MTGPRPGAAWETDPDIAFESTDGGVAVEASDGETLLRCPSDER